MEGVRKWSCPVVSSLHGGQFAIQPKRDYLFEFRAFNGLALFVHTVRYGDSNTVPLALKDIFLIQLVNGAEDGQHELLTGCGCVDDLPLDTNSTPLFVRCSTKSSKSWVLRAKRPIDSTTTVSPFQTKVIMCFGFRQSVFLPLMRWIKPDSHPVPASAPPAGQCFDRWC